MATGNDSVADIADHTEKKRCKTEGCKKKYLARGYCKDCYNAKRRLMGQKPRDKDFSCPCGFSSPAIGGYARYISHMYDCQAMKGILYSEIERIAILLGRYPYFREYKEYREKSAPSAEWVLKYIGTWVKTIEAVADRINLDADLSIDEQVNTDPASRVNFQKQYEELPPNTFSASSVRSDGNENYYLLR